LKSKCDELLSNVAFSINLRRYSKELDTNEQFDCKYFPTGEDTRSVLTAAELAAFSKGHASGNEGQIEAGPHNVF
jgi:hypothetical protein